jgi:hypothetical protein
MTPKEQKFCDEYLIDLNAAQAAIRAGYELKDNHDNKNYYVYFLINSINGNIFYVGKGIKNRALMHLKEYKKGIINNSIKFKEIDNIISNNGNVIVKYFSIGLSESFSFEKEYRLIGLFKNYGLTNISGGVVNNDKKILISAENNLKRMINFDKWIKIKQRTEKEIQYYFYVRNNFKEIISLLSLNNQ